MFLDFPSLLAGPGVLMNLSSMCRGQMFEMHWQIKGWGETVDRLQAEAQPKEVETNRLLAKIKDLEEEGKLVSPLSHLTKKLEVNLYECASHSCL